MTTTTEPKRFYLSETDKKLAGVCGGLAEYFHIDSTIIRLIVVVIGVITGGAALIGYIIMALVAPKRPPASIEKQ